jgi:hypothetical protein
MITEEQAIEWARRTEIKHRFRVDMRDLLPLLQQAFDAGRKDSLQTMKEDHENDR